MILINDDYIWEINDSIVRKLIPLEDIPPKGTLSLKQKCVLNQILDKFKRKPEVPALLKPRKGL